MVYYTSLMRPNWNIMNKKLINFKRKNSPIKSYENWNNDIELYSFHGIDVEGEISRMLTDELRKTFLKEILDTIQLPRVRRPFS